MTNQKKFEFSIVFDHFSIFLNYHFSKNFQSYILSFQFLPPELGLLASTEGVCELFISVHLIEIKLKNHYLYHIYHSNILLVCRKLTTIRDELATDLFELEDEYYSSTYK